MHVRLIWDWAVYLFDLSAICNRFSLCSIAVCVCCTATLCQSKNAISRRSMCALHCTTLHLSAVYAGHLLVQLDWSRKQDVMEQLLIGLAWTFACGDTDSALDQAQVLLMYGALSLIKRIHCPSLFVCCLTVWSNRTPFPGQIDSDRKSILRLSITNQIQNLN